MKAKNLNQSTARQKKDISLRLLSELKKQQLMLERIQRLTWDSIDNAIYKIASDAWKSPEEAKQYAEKN